MKNSRKTELPHSYNNYKQDPTEVIKASLSVLSQY